MHSLYCVYLFMVVLPCLPIPLTPIKGTVNATVTGLHRALTSECDHQSSESNLGENPADSLKGTSETRRVEAVKINAYIFGIICAA